METSFHPSANHFTGLTELVKLNLYMWVHVEVFVEDTNEKENINSIYLLTAVLMNGRRDASSEVAEGAISTSHKPQLTGICKQTPEGIVGN